MSAETSLRMRTVRDRSYPQIGLHVAGRWIYDRAQCHEIRNPSNNELLGSVPRATKEDLASALEAAQRSFVIWRDTAPEERAQLLMRAMILVRERSDMLAGIITLEQGKPFADAKIEVDRASRFLEWDAAELMRSYGTVLPSPPGMRRLVIRQPVGPVAAFTPWNVPISSPSRKVSAALAAGCSVVLKAAEETPGTACAYLQCLLDAGLPAGVVSLVFGDPAEISSTLIESPIIRMVTLTGSIAVGKRLAKLAGEKMKPVLMELDRKSVV